jgi:hypothetical protein
MICPNLNIGISLQIIESMYAKGKLKLLYNQLRKPHGFNWDKIFVGIKNKLFTYA